MRGRLGEVCVVNSETIEKDCGVPHTRGNSMLRRIIITVCEKYNIPIVSNIKGYFVAQSKDELMNYLMNLELRIRGIIERKDTLLRSFESYNDL
jgi:hypothetical protein